MKPRIAKLGIFSSSCHIHDEQDGEGGGPKKKVGLGQLGRAETSFLQTGVTRPEDHARNRMNLLYEMSSAFAGK